MRNARNPPADAAMATTSVSPLGVLVGSSVPESTTWPSAVSARLSNPAASGGTSVTVAADALKASTAAWKPRTRKALC